MKVFEGDVVESKVLDLCGDTATIVRDERPDGRKVVAVIFQDAQRDVVVMHYDLALLTSFISALTEARDKTFGER